MCDDGVKCMACGVTAGVSVLTIVILIISSLSNLEPTEAGLRYMGAAKTLDTEELWMSGRHLIGPSQKFYVFPKTTQIIKFSKDAGSDDGFLEARTNVRCATAPPFCPTPASPHPPGRHFCALVCAMAGRPGRGSGGQFQLPP